MKKRLTALGLAVLLVLSLFGCATKPKKKDPIQEFIDNKKGGNSEFVGFGKEDEITKDPLTICMDVEYVQDPLAEVDVILNEFLSTLDQSGGLTDVVIEYVPKHGATEKG